MNILPTPEVAEQKPTTTKRKNRSIDFAALGPLKTKGTVGFSGYRDPSGGSTAAKNMAKDPDDMDSDQDEDARKPNGRIKHEADTLDEDGDMPALSAEELTKRGELAEGVKKMQVRETISSPIL